jgi:hypothetical protein
MPAGERAAAAAANINTQLNLALISPRAHRPCAHFASICDGAFRSQTAH